MATMQFLAGQPHVQGVLFCCFETSWLVGAFYWATSDQYPVTRTLGSTPCNEDTQLNAL